MHQVICLGRHHEKCCPGCPHGQPHAPVIVEINSIKPDCWTGLCLRTKDVVACDLMRDETVRGGLL